MEKLLWPSLTLQSSVTSSTCKGGTSETLASVLVRPRWNDAVDGFLDNCGEATTDILDVSAIELTMDNVLFGSAIVGDCRGLWTGSTTASSEVFIMGGRSGVEDKALRSYGSPTLSEWTSSIGETGVLLQITDIAGVGGMMSFWSKPGK
jgi:hypothetical protein